MAEEMFGPYRLEGRIGRGGMGEVHRAFDTRRHRTVALKLLHSDLAAQEEFRERFRREALLAARLQEPHIVPIHDFGEIDGRLYIDMRFVQGRDAAAVLRQEGPMPVQRALGLVGQIAAALDAAHADGVVHRDVKPSNILLTPSEFGYLVDFGIARAALDGTASGLTSTGSAVGTVQYMAPEQFDGTAIDGRVDVYALSCVFFELITGVPPFRGGSLPAVMQAHLHEPPPRASAVRPGVPPELDAVIAHGMGKRPHERFGTAGELVRAAHSVLHRAPGPVPVTAPPPDRRRWVIAAAGAAAVVAVAIGSAVAIAAAGGGGAAPTSSAAPPPTTAPAPPTTADSGLTGADRDLAASVDPAVLSGCRPVAQDPQAIGLVASAQCVSRSTQPVSSVVVLRFASSSDLAAHISREAQVVESTSADPDQGCPVGQFSGTWASGTLVCRPAEMSDLRIAWTFDDRLVMAYAEGASPAFYEWWGLNGSFLR